MSAIATHLAQIRTKTPNATLIAVSKTRSIEEIRQALKAGQRVFGENRVQEAQAKFPDLRKDHPDIELHLIGALQTNKAQTAVELFDVIQTVDRPDLAKALAKAIQRTGRTPRLYVEVNIGREPQKAGILPEQLEAFLTYCRTDCGLSLTGLMCIPPHDQDPAPYFQQMRKLADEFSLPQLSMGMSGDYETAIQYGATEIRVGTAIFGERLR